MRNGATWQLELGRTVRAELQLKLDFLILPPAMSSNLGPVCGESGCSGKTDTQPVARVVGTYLHCVGHRDMVLPASGGQAGACLGVLSTSFRSEISGF